MFINFIILCFVKTLFFQMKEAMGPRKPISAPGEGNNDTAEAREKVMY